MLIVARVLVIVIDGPIGLGEVGLERLLHVRHVHALPLGEAVRDDRVVG